MVMAMIVLTRFGPRIATARMASTRLGTAMMTSMRRVMSTSARPLKAASSPSMTPMPKDTAMTAKPMNSDTRAP